MVKTHGACEGDDKIASYTFVYFCVCVCVVYAHAGRHVCPYTEARGECWVSGSITLHIIHDRVSP